MAVPAASLANLKPYQPGQSGNPAGKKRGTFNLTTAMQRLAPRAAKRLAAMLDSDDDKQVLAAAKVIFDRGYGLPTGTVSVSASGQITHTHVLSREQLLAIASGQTTEAADDAGIEDVDFTPSDDPESGDNPEQDQRVTGHGGDA